MTRVLFGWKSIAEYIGCSITTAQKYSKEKKLPVNKIGRKPTSDTERILKWIRKQK